VDVFHVDVKRLSSPQVNVGNYLKNDALSFIPGAYSFDLNTNSASYEFQFNVNQGETNLDVLKKLANLVNRSTLSLNAAIRTGSAATGGEGTSALALTSIQTGLDEGESFLFDIAPGASADSIKAMDLLGIHQITHPSENSLFYLNGEEHTSLSNTFTINNTFELTLKSITPEDSPTQICFKTSTDAVADNIMSLVNAFNGILGIAANSSSNATGESNKLLSEISGLSRVRKESLAEVGLVVADDGSISLDKEILAEAITPERSADTFQALSRFKSAIGAKADNVAINPMNYVNKKVVAYKNPGKTWAAPYFASVYSGMLLDIKL
jgi:flagellar hook-associated protein 2